VRPGVEQLFERKQSCQSFRRIRLTKTDLDRIPADERFFYLMAGHFANDVTILSQLLIAAFNSAFGRPGEFSRDEPHNAAGLAQLFLVLKLLAGRLHEASRLIACHYFAKGLDKKYENEMSEKARNARRQFSAYFGQVAQFKAPPDAFVPLRCASPYPISYGD
jgi:hypothetical protein